MRKILFWMHLAAGILASALILFFSATGALLAYERQVVHAADTHSYHFAPQSTGAARLSVDQLLANAATVIPAPLDSLTVHPDGPVEVTTAHQDIYFLDPYTTRLQGPMSPRTRAFFAEVTALHRWFGLGNASHAAATAVKGATTLVFLFLLCSGAYLWLPRSYTWSAMRVGIVPRLNAQGRARNYNWHKVAGLWAGLPLAVIALTGAIIAYPWANALVFRAAGSPVPMRTGRRADRSHAKAPVPSHLDAAIALVLDGAGHWRSVTIPLADDGRQLRITLDRGDGGRPEKREQLFVDPLSGRIIKREAFTSLSRGQQWRTWVRFVHTGEAGGIWGETLALLTTLGAIVLSCTGVGLTYNRLRRWASTQTGERLDP